MLNKDKVHSHVGPTVRWTAQRMDVSLWPAAEAQESVTNKANKARTGRSEKADTEQWGGEERFHLPATGTH